MKIENGELTKNTLYPKKIKLNQIKSISEFAGDLKLITDENEFVIDTQIIEPHSLVELKNELKNMSLIFGQRGSLTLFKIMVELY